jgi:two-component system NtrC family response regulator
MYRNTNILIADDDETLCYLLKEELINEGFHVETVYDGKDAIEQINNKQYNLLLLDLSMKEVSGEEVLEYLKENDPELQVIVLTATTEMRTAINCIRMGAFDYITKPYDFQQLLLTIEKALEHKDLVNQNKILETKLEVDHPHKIIGESEALKKVLDLAEKAAQSDTSILLEGETGTGKELFAEFIHEHSVRNKKPLVTINCASLPDQLIESELFGYEKGAFTDAKASKQGLVEIADGGTLFLDEIGELSLALQPKLLRFIEKGDFRRIGGVKNLASDVRIIGATNRNLFDEVERKNFRRDLLFRMNVITLTIPPLRERGNDVIILADHFLNEKVGVRENKYLSDDAKEALLKYYYPGNVRELEHVIERAIVFSDKEVIEPKDLNLPRNISYEIPHSPPPQITEPEEEINFDVENVMPLDEVEKHHIKSALEKHDWNRADTARALGISQKTLYTKIKKYNIT